MKRLVFGICMLAFIGPATGQNEVPKFITDSLDSYIKRGMAAENIPGLAIAIVKDGKIIVSKGYGVKRLGQSDPVDENTLFYIASNSKLFTATALANLSEAKKLTLEDKVVTHLPTFKLYDTLDTRMASIRDLLSNRLGLKDNQGDFLFWDSNFSRQDVMQSLRLLKPTAQLRQEYGYCNAAFVAAGLIIPKVTGKSWEDYVTETILKPLEMGRTRMVTEGFAKLDNIAYPYSTCCNAEGKAMEVQFDNLDNIGPAGSMVSSVKDMSKWLLMQLDSGRHNNKQIIPWSVLTMTRRPNTIISYQKHPVAPFTHQFYCLGVGLMDYAQMDVYSHAGGAFGYHTNTTFVPSKGLGIVVLINQDFSNFHEALRFQILDAFAKLPFVDRSQYFLSRAKVRDKKQQEEISSMVTRIEKAKQPPLPLSAYTGTYANPTYGTVAISVDKAAKENQDLIVHFQHHPNMTAKLKYMDHDQFRLSFSNPRFGTSPALFTTKNGLGNSIDVKATDFVDFEPYRFSRVSPK